MNLTAAVILVRTDGGSFLKLSISSYSQGQKMTPLPLTAEIVLADRYVSTVSTAILVLQISTLTKR